jgi:hypothetical protein
MFLMLVYFLNFSLIESEVTFFLLIFLKLSSEDKSILEVSLVILLLLLLLLLLSSSKSKFFKGELSLLLNRLLSELSSPISSSKIESNLFCSELIFSKTEKIKKRNPL